MDTKNSIIILFFLAIAFINSTTANNYPIITFKRAYCGTENPKSVIINTCTVNTSENAFDVNVTLKRRFTKPLPSVIGFSALKEGKFRDVVKTPNFELCETMANYKLIPPFLKSLFEVMGDTAKPILKGCPYSGTVELIHAIGQYEVAIGFSCRNI